MFPGVQQPVCIVLAARTPDADADTPARVRYAALPEGHRRGKFTALANLTLDGEAWEPVADGWRASFLPAASGAWAGYPALDDLFRYDGSGVMAGRTWPIAPDADSLRRRWNRLVAESDPERKQEFFRPHQGGDRTLEKPDNTKGIPGHNPRSMPVGEDTRDVVPPIRYGYRSFDRQFIIPDKRLINRENPTIWKYHSDRQVYLTALNRTSPSSGPALTISGLIPDHDHYNGKTGRVFPLWADAAASRPNVNPNLLAHLGEAYGTEISAPDLVAYLAAVAAHPGYVERFGDDLTQPGLRIPLTADGSLFAEAVALGREVVWLHTYGERFADATAGRPARPPRVEHGPTPVLSAPIPDRADEIAYDADDERLVILGSGSPGIVEHVPPAVGSYEVSGKNVLTQWFSYRKADRSKPPMGDKRPPSPLNAIQPDRWLADYTTDLLDLVHVLTRLVDLEPAQADLLARICAAPTLDADDLRAAGAFDA